MAYADAAQERLDRAAAGDFDTMVEAVRVGMIFAHDQKQYGRWRDRSRSRSSSRALTGEALEAAVRRVARQFPDQVVEEAR